MLGLELTASAFVDLIAGGFAAGVVAGSLIAVLTFIYPGRDHGGPLE